MREKQPKPNKSIKPRRIFSETVKRTIVKDIERGKCSVLEASRELTVSDVSIYNWIYKYSLHLKKNRVMVVEDQSESYKSRELEKRILELEAAVGRKQIEIDILNKIIELANAEFDTDLKKNSEQQLSSVSTSKKGSPTITK